MYFFCFQWGGGCELKLAEVMASKFSKLVRPMENCCRFVKQLKNNVTTTMNKYYTFKWQLEITEFSPILMPSSTIEFITTEDFGMGVQF